MYIDIPKKKLAFRILASLLLLSTIAMLFIPSILITTTETSEGKSTTTSTRYSAVSIIAGAYSTTEQQDFLDTKDGKTFVSYIKTKGEEQNIGDKRTTYTFAFLMILTVVFAFLGALTNFLTLLKKCPKFIKVIESVIPFFILGTLVCAVASFCMAYFWVSGAYIATYGSIIVRTAVKSYGYLGLLFNMLLPLVAYVCYHDRTLEV